MSDRLPSVNALWECALGVRIRPRAIRASSEAAKLNLTPDAIGHHVKSLDADFGFPPFVRQH